MKAAVIFFVPIATSAAVCWRWRSTDGTVDSHRSFMHYRECFEDARTNGYDVETAQARPGTPPSGTFSPEQRRQYEQFLAAEPGPTRH